MNTQWAQQVRAALQADDGPVLAALFDLAVEREGRAAASRSWLDAISAFDADAITG